MKKLSSWNVFFNYLKEEKFKFINKILPFAIGGNPLPLVGGRSLYCLDRNEPYLHHK